MRFEETLVKVVLGLQPAEELPAIATAALCEGNDSPSLRILAGSNPADPPAELWELLSKVTRELGLATPDKETAARLLLRLYLRDIADAKVAPAQGVQMIISHIYHPFGHKLNKKYVGDGLGIEKMLGAYYTYEDAESGRLEYQGRRVTMEEAHAILDQSIVEEAKRLLAQPSP